MAGKKGYGILNNPYGTANATNFHTSIPWTENADSKYDWGLIEPDENIGEDTEWFTYKYVSESLTDRYVTISGYPQSDRYYQYKMRSQITDDTDYNIYYEIDTTGGQSGSPIYTDGYIVYGIHTNGNGGVNDAYNFVTRITADMYDYFEYTKANT